MPLQHMHWATSKHIGRTQPSDNPTTAIAMAVNGWCARIFYYIIELTSWSALSTNFPIDLDVKHGTSRQVAISWEIVEMSQMNKQHHEGR
jgi:hypothetical protein